MKVIWKFILEVNRQPQRVAMPTGAKLLYVREQNDDICLWIECDVHVPTEIRTFEVLGTGMMHPDVPFGLQRVYVGSAHLRNGALVYHVYERKQ